MAYETNIVTNTLNLLEALRVYVTGLGWTVNENTLVDANTRELHINKGTTYINFRARNLSPAFTLSLNGSTGYSGASLWDRQPGAYLNPNITNDYHIAAIRCESGSMTYHFFSFDSGNQVHVVVERSAGIFQHLGFGKLSSADKVGSWTGGDYFYANNAPDDGNLNRAGLSVWNAAVSQGQAYRSGGGSIYIDGVDGYTGWCVNNGWSSGSSGRGVYDQTSLWLYNLGIRRLVNDFNSRAIVVPVELRVIRGTTSRTYNATTQHSILGKLPVFYTNNKYLLDGQLVTIGGVDYRVFPSYTKVDNWTNVLTPSATHTGYGAVAIPVL